VNLPEASGASNFRSATAACSGTSKSFLSENQGEKTTENQGGRDLLLEQILWVPKSPTTGIIGYPSYLLRQEEKESENQGLQVLSEVTQEEARLIWPERKPEQWVYAHEVPDIEECHLPLIAQQVSESENFACACTLTNVCRECEGIPREIGFNNLDVTKVEIMRDCERRCPKRVFPAAVEGYSTLEWLGYRRIFGGVTTMTHASHVIFFLFLQFGFGKAAPSQWAENYALIAPATSWLIIALAVLWLVYGLLSRFDRYAEQAKKAFYWSLGIQGVTALVGLGSIVSTLWTANRRYTLPPQGARQTANKTGMFMTGMLSLMMLLLAPIMGSKKIVEMCKPVLELLKQIPYASWMAEWLHDWWEGKVDFDDLPEDPADEVRQYAKKVYGEYANAQREYDGAKNTEPVKPKGFRFHGRGTTINAEGVDYCRVIRFDIKQEQCMRLEDFCTYFKMQRFEVPITCKLFNKERIFSTVEDFLEFLEDPNGPYEQYLAEGHVVCRPKDESSHPLPNVVSFDYSHMEGATEVMKAEERLAKAKEKMDALNSEQRAFVEDADEKEVVREAMQGFSDASEKLKTTSASSTSSEEHGPWSGMTKPLEPQCFFEEEEIREAELREKVRPWRSAFSPKQYWTAFTSLFVRQAVRKSDPSQPVTTFEEVMPKAYDVMDEEVEKAKLRADEESDSGLWDVTHFLDSCVESVCDWWSNTSYGPKLDEAADQCFFSPYEKARDYVSGKWNQIPLKVRKATKVCVVVLCAAAYMWSRSRDETELDDQKAGWNLKGKGGRNGKQNRRGGPRRNIGRRKPWDYSEGPVDHPEDVWDETHDRNADRRWDGPDYYGRMDGQSTGPQVPSVIDDSAVQRAIFKSKKLRIRVDTQDYLQWLNESRQAYQKALEKKQLTPQAWNADQLAAGVYKIYDSENRYLCSGTLVADQMFVVMHALSEDQTKIYYARNHVHSIVMRASTLTPHNDHIASFKVSGYSTPFKATAMKKLTESSIVTVFGYGEGLASKPDSIVGFASPSGWCTAATRRGDCTSPVLDKEGRIVGFWTHGDGEQFGRFEVVSDQLLAFIRQARPVTHSGLDFQSTPRYRQL